MSEQRQRPALLIGAIKSLLEQHDDDTVRARTWAIFQTYVREHQRHEKGTAATGYYDRPHATTFASFASCPREVAFGALGYEGDQDKGWRTRNTFAQGHMIEAWVNALLEQTGAELYTREVYPVPGWDVHYSPKDWYHTIRVQPDGIVLLTQEQRNAVANYMGDAAFDPGLRAVVEVKSIGNHGFDRWLEQGVQAAKPGYYDQAQIEMAGAGTNIAIFLVMCKNDGRLHEEFVWFDKQRFEVLTDLFNDIYEVGLPMDIEATWGPKQQFEFFRGKNKGKKDALAYAIEFGYTTIPEPAIGTNNQIYGWNLCTGWVLPWQCGYCPYKAPCYSKYTIRLDTSSGKPVWWVDDYDPSQP